MPADLPKKIILRDKGGGPDREMHLVFLRVDLWNEDGTPLQVTVCGLDDAMELDRDAEKNRFITAYMTRVKKED
jgi:hypothetical protein